MRLFLLKQPHIFLCCAQKQVTCSKNKEVFTIPDIKTHKPLLIFFYKELSSL